MLQRAAARLRAHELDTVVIAQHAYVVGDDAEWSAQLHGEVARARDALAEPLQDACAQRMSQAFAIRASEVSPGGRVRRITGWG